MDFVISKDTEAIKEAEATKEESKEEDKDLLFLDDD